MSRWNEIEGRRAKLRRLLLRSRIKTVEHAAKAMGTAVDTAHKDLKAIGAYKAHDEYGGYYKLIRQDTIGTTTEEYQALVETEVAHKILTHATRMFVWNDDILVIEVEPGSGPLVGKWIRELDSLFIASVMVGDSNIWILGDAEELKEVFNFHELEYKSLIRDAD